MTSDTKLTIIKPDDWHLHLRGGYILRAVLPYSAKWNGRAIVMPNGPMIRTAVEAKLYQEEIITVRDELCQGSAFQPLMTIYLTPDTDPDDVERGFDEGIVKAVKRYPKGATTGSEAGVEDLESNRPVFKMMERRGIPLLCHDEVVVNNGEEVDDYEREAVFMDTIGYKLVHDYPDLPISMEHIGKLGAIEFVEKYGGPRLVATVTPHHATFDRRDRYRHGGNAPDLTCRPFIGDLRDRDRLWKLLKKRPSFLFLGTDSAPWLDSKKASPTMCPCGCFNSPNAIGMYADIFERLGVLDYLEEFACLNGPRFYNMKPNSETITLVKKPWRARGLVPSADGAIRPVGYRHNRNTNLEVAWQQA